MTCRGCVLFCAAIIGMPSLVKGQDPEQLAAFRDHLQARVVLIERRHTDEVRALQELYVSSIRSLAEQAVQAGDLDRVLLLRGTADLFEHEMPAPVSPPLQDDAAFRRLEQTWERHYAELRKRRAADLLRAYQNYAQMIEPLQRQWTQAGDIEAALAVQQERRRIEQLPEREQLEADAAWDPPPDETAPVDPSATGLPGLTIFQANMVLYLPFDQRDRGGRIFDRSRERHVGEAQRVEHEMRGRLGMAVRFASPEARIVIPTSESLQLTGNMTLSFWIRPERFEARRNPIEKAYGGEFTITQETDGHLNFYHGTAGANAQPYQGFNTGRPLPLNEWTHVVLVRDSRERKLTWYFDGTAVNETASQFAEAAASNQPVRIGQGYAGPFAGLLDEVLILNTALNARQVRQLYRILGGR